jgi:acyl-CoA synthetase (AMP-forming)/AMP-acid ligase II
MTFFTDTQANITHARTYHHWPPTQHRTPFRNLRDALALHAKTSGSKPFLISYDAANHRDELTYVEFVARCHQIANLLFEDLGVRRGDRVAVMAHNAPEVVLVYMACWIIGAAVVPQNISEDDARIGFILRNSEAKLLFVQQPYADRARAILQQTPTQIQGVIQIGGEPAADVLLFEDIVRSRSTTFLGDESGAKSGDLSIRSANEHTPQLDDEALIVYTSGTTGAPKGVVLSQYNLIADAQAIAQWHAITGNQRLMCVLPLHHVNGIVVTLITPLLVGGSVVLNQKFSVHHFWERVAREKVQIVSVVPTLLQYLLDYAQSNIQQGETIFGHGINRLNLAMFRHFICGAGTLSVRLASDFEDVIGFPIVHGYGLSETTCYSCFLPVMQPWDEHQRWMRAHGYPSIGCPIEVNEMGIFSVDGSGQRLGAGERGEICVRGHNVMLAYYQREDANVEAFKFGWFRTGDEGFYLDGEDGRPYFFITGRIKELINRGGVKFSPFEIEEVALRAPGVKLALAVAFENDYYGEEVGLYVVPQEGIEPDAEAILQHCRAVLRFDKSPKVVVFGTEVPVTSTGKYQRLKLRDLFAAYRGVQFRP